MTACKVCLSDDRGRAEELGLQAQAEVISWSEAERQCGYTRQSLRTHMDRHFVNEELRGVEEEFDTSIKEAVEDLFRAMRTAPPEVKPLYAAAIRNLQGLKDTKPSQQHLIMALKTIQEMTGMKQEQRMMLVFAEAMFSELDAKKAPAIEVAEVIELSNPYASDSTSEGGRSHGSHEQSAGSQAR